MDQKNNLAPPMRVWGVTLLIFVIIYVLMIVALWIEPQLFSILLLAVTETPGIQGMIKDFA